MKRFLLLFLALVLATQTYANTYEFTVHPGAIINSSFTVVPVDIKAMNAVSPFIVTLTQHTFSDQTHNTEIDYTIQVPDKIQAGTYYTYITITQEKADQILVNGTYVDTNYEITEVQNEIRINVIDYMNYTFLNLNSQVVNVDSPSTGFANFSLVNSGNHNIVARVSATEIFDIISSDIFLAPFTNYTFSVPYSIVENFQPGLKSVTLKVTHIATPGQAQFPDQFINVTFNVSDKTPPSLNATISKNTWIYNDIVELCWNSTDVSGIKTLNYTFLGKDTVLPQNLGCTNLYANATGNIEIIVNSVDTYNNFNQVKIPLTVNKIDIGTINTNFRFKTVKPNNKASELLMHLTRPVTFNISLTYLYKTNYTDAKIITSIESTSSNVLLEPGNSYTPTLDGDVYLSAEGNYLGDYSVQVSLNFPNWANAQNTTINAIGTIKEYSTCQSGIVTIWGQEFNSTPIDGGNLEDSYCFICGKYAIDYNVVNTAIPCTKQAEDDLKANYQSQIDSLRTEKDADINTKNWIIVALVFLMLAASAIILFMLFGKKNRVRIGG